MTDDPPHAFRQPVQSAKWRLLRTTAALLSLAVMLRTAELGAVEIDLAFKFDDRFAFQPDEMDDAFADDSIDDVLKDDGDALEDSQGDMEVGVIQPLVQPEDFDLSVEPDVEFNDSRQYWEGSGVCGTPARSNYVPYVARVRVGTSYFDDLLASRLGGIYRLDVTLPLDNQWEAFGGVTFNHFSEGSQYQGTAGIFRQGIPSCCTSDRLSGGVLFDHFIDTRFDDIKLSQFRFFLGLAVSDKLGVGVTYTEPVETDTAVVAGLGTGASLFRAARVVEAYASRWIGKHRITGTIGYREDPNETVLGLIVRRKLRRGITTYASTTYHSPSIWTATSGLEWQFGAGSSRGPVSMGYASTTNSSEFIVRGQSSGAAGNPFHDASLGHNLDYGPEEFSAQATVDGANGIVVVGGPESEGEFNQ